MLDLIRWLSVLQTRPTGSSSTADLAQRGQATLEKIHLRHCFPAWVTLRTHTQACIGSRRSCSDLYVFQVVGFSSADSAGQGRQDSSNKRQKTSAAVLPERRLSAGNVHLDYRHEQFEVSNPSKFPAFRAYIDSVFDDPSFPHSHCSSCAIPYFWMLQAVSVGPALSRLSILTARTHAACLSLI